MRARRELVRDMITVNDERVTTPQPYDLVLAGNIAAARTRMRLHQSDLAERMHVLGWKWAKQTVSEIEAGRRAVRARELLGLALALDTTIVALTSAPVGMMAVVLPNGEPVGAYRITTPDGTFTWDGNRLKISPSARPGPLIDAAITEKRREAAELEAFRDHLRSGAPGEYAPAHPGDRGAANIRPYRTGEQPSEPLDE